MSPSPRGRKAIMAYARAYLELSPIRLVHGNTIAVCAEGEPPRAWALYRADARPGPVDWVDDFKTRELALAAIDAVLRDEPNCDFEVSVFNVHRGVAASLPVALMAQVA
jgi:hypothetical protein